MWAEVGKGNGGGRRRGWSTFMSGDAGGGKEEVDELTPGGLLSTKSPLDSRARLGI